MSVKVLNTGIVQASGEIGENLFVGSDFSDRVVATLISNSSTDWTKPLRHYNGGTSLHKFSDMTDTITLGNGGNIGIAFAILASDINLDSTSYYTISCESKCSKSGAHLDIGLSYLNTSDTWVWRGGTGAQNYTAVDTWQTFYRTFKPDADTKAIDYCFTVVGASGGTDTFSIRRCKLEKGSVATTWCPSPLDDSFVCNLSGFNEYNGVAQITKGQINAPDFMEI